MTNDIPEAGLIDLVLDNQGLIPVTADCQQAGAPEGQAGQAPKNFVSEQIDRKNMEELTSQEKLDKKN